MNNNNSLSIINSFEDAKKFLVELTKSRELMIPILIENRSIHTVEIAKKELEILYYIIRTMNSLDYFEIYAKIKIAIDKAFSSEANYLNIQLAINDNCDYSKTNHFKINLR